MGPMAETLARRIPKVWYHNSVLCTALGETGGVSGGRESINNVRQI